MFFSVFIASTFYLSPFAKKAQRQWVERVEERLKLTSYMLGDMKAVKMLGLSDRMYSMIQKLRELELVTSTKFRKLLLWQLFLCTSTRTEQIERKCSKGNMSLTDCSKFTPVLGHRRNLCGLCCRGALPA